MTLGPSNLTSGHAEGASVGGFTTASVSPTAGSLLVLSVGGFDGTGSQDITVSAVSGFGATWQRQHLGVAGSTPKGDVEVWTAKMPGSPGSGTITVTLTASLSCGFAWSVDQYTGQDATTPVVTGNTVFANNSSAASAVTYGAAASGSNLFHYASVVLLGTGGTATQAPSETPAWTSLASLQSDTTSFNGVALNTQVSPDVTHLTGSASWTGSHSWGTIGLEIAAASGATFTGTGTAALSLAASSAGVPAKAGSGQAALALAAGSSGQSHRSGAGAAALALLALAPGSSHRSGTGVAALALVARSVGIIPGTVGERQLVRLAVASYFGGAQVTTDAGVCFQGGPLASFGLGTAYPYTVRHVPDEYYTAGMPDGQDWGCVLSTTRLERSSVRDSYGGKASGWRKRLYAITCEIALICELPHIEVAGAGLDDLIDQVHALIAADRTLGTTSLATGARLIIEAGEGRTGIRDVTDKFAALDEVKGRYAAEATVTFDVLTMVEG